MSIRTVGLWLSLKSTNSRCQTGVKRLKTTYKGYVVKKPAVCFHLTLKPAPACAAHFNRSSVQNRRVWFTQTENSSRKTLTTTETTNVGRTSSFVLNMLISGQPWQSHKHFRHASFSSKDRTSASTTQQRKPLSKSICTVNLAWFAPKSSECSCITKILFILFKTIPEAIYIYFLTY